MVLCYSKPQKYFRHEKSEEKNFLCYPVYMRQLLIQFIKLQTVFHIYHRLILGTPTLPFNMPTPNKKY